MPLSTEVPIQQKVSIRALWANKTIDYAQWERKRFTQNSLGHLHDSRYSRRYPQVYQRASETSIYHPCRRRKIGTVNPSYQNERGSQRWNHQLPAAAPDWLRGCLPTWAVPSSFPIPYLVGSLAPKLINEREMDESRSRETNDSLLYTRNHVTQFHLP